MNTLTNILHLPIFILCLSITTLSHANTNNPSKEYDLLEFDWMIEKIRPHRKGDIEITMFRKIQFDAEIEELPTPRISNYLNKLIDDFIGNQHPKVSMGMMAKSDKGNSWNLYIVDELVPQANALLQPGDKVTLYAYHAYTTDYGPGVVVHAFDRHARPGLWEKTVQWLHKVTNTDDI